MVGAGDRCLWIAEQDIDAAKLGMLHRLPSRAHAMRLVRGPRFDHRREAVQAVGDTDSTFERMTLVRHCPSMSRTTLICLRSRMARNCSR